MWGTGEDENAIHSKASIRPSSNDQAAFNHASDASCLRHGSKVAEPEPLPSLELLKGGWQIHSFIIQAVPSFDAIVIGRLKGCVKEGQGDTLLTLG